MSRSEMTPITRHTGAYSGDVLLQRGDCASEGRRTGSSPDELDGMDVSVLAAPIPCVHDGAHKQTMRADTTPSSLHSFTHSRPHSLSRTPSRSHTLNHSHKHVHVHRSTPLPVNKRGGTALTRFHNAGGHTEA